jgi:hypothetical protein
MTQIRLYTKGGVCVHLNVTKLSNTTDNGCRLWYNNNKLFNFYEPIDKGTEGALISFLH